ncbi:hypothetical protein T484DRAFT_1834227 [Baffinella frigidus]|nr:hypothetical protein T484DRAFT_1834227 [Cryptophyta sp. CCMP2293]
MALVCGLDVADTLAQLPEMQKPTAGVGNGSKGRSQSPTRAKNGSKSPTRSQSPTQRCTGGVREEDLAWVRGALYTPLEVRKVPAEDAVCADLLARMLEAFTSLLDNEPSTPTGSEGSDGRGGPARHDLGPSALATLLGALNELGVPDEAVAERPQQRRQGPLHHSAVFMSACGRPVHIAA